METKATIIRIVGALLASTMIITLVIVSGHATVTSEEKTIVNFVLLSRRRLWML